MKVVTNSLVLLCLVFLVSCQENPKQEETVKSQDSINAVENKPTQLFIRNDSIIIYNHLDTIDDRCIKTDTNGGFHYLLQGLDSIQRLNWSDKFMARDNMYDAHLISVQHPIKNIRPYVIYTNADDWSHGFFITTNNGNELIDYIQVTDNYGDASSNEDGSEIVYEDIQKAIMQNDSSFTTYYGHYKIVHKGNSEKITLDSIIDTYKILSNGKIKLIKEDSMRINR